MKKELAGSVILFLCLGHFPHRLRAQTESLENLLKTNSYALVESSGHLSGNGMDFLMQASADAQFFAIGEEHFVKEIPEITTMLFEALHEHYGFNYLALESDPVSARMVSVKPLVGKREAVFSLARKYPNAFTFNTDQEIAMIAQVGRISTGKGNKIWGLDQVFGALHVLDRLAELAPSREIRERTHKLAEDARLYENVRRTAGRFYMTSDVPKPEDFVKLPEWYRQRKGSEADFLIQQLLLSERVFRNNRQPKEGEAPTTYESNREREENMKSLFMSEYRHAQAAGERLPKVVLKFGQLHLFRGINRVNVPTLGNFVSEFAKSNGMKTFHLYLYTHNKPGGFRPISPASALRPLADLADIDKWTVFDLRPLRTYVHAGRTKVSQPLGQLIFTYDAVLLLGGASPSTSVLTLGK